MTRSRRLNRAMAALGVAATLALLASSAQAGLIGGALNVTATNAAGDVATIEVAVPSGRSPWIWSSDQLMEMRSPTTGALIATLNPPGRETRVEYVDDPVIGLTFGVQAGPSTTTFVITSALLSFPALMAEAQASAGFTVTDFDGDGATLTGIGDPNGADGAYLAQYNGFAGTLSGTTFAEMIQIVTTGVYETSTASSDYPGVGFQTILTPVTDMSVLVSFRLTPNDLASGTSVYVLQQRPVATEPTTWGRIKTLF